MRYKGPLSPAQAAAFWRLGVLTGEDLPRLAMQWLEEGSDSPEVAALAGQANVTVSEYHDRFERCLRQQGVTLIASEREAAWHYIRTLLVAMREGAIAPLDATNDVLLMHSRGIALFPPRNLADDGSTYAGEELGVELMVGLFYDFDDGGLSDKAWAQLTEQLRAECLRVLEAFYTEPPPDLA